MYDTVASIIDSLKAPTPDPAAALAAVEALKRRMFQEGSKYGATPPYAGDDGLAPTFEELPALISALPAWQDHAGREHDPRIALTVYRAMELRQQGAAGIATSGAFTFSRAPTPHEWQEAIGIADHALNQLKDALEGGHPAVLPSAPVTVDDEDLLILRALARLSPRLLTQDTIESEGHVSRRTISSRMPDLLRNGLVAQPKGPKSGTIITAAGQRLLDQLDRAKPAR